MVGIFCNSRILTRLESNVCYGWNIQDIPFARITRVLFLLPTKGIKTRRLSGTLNGCQFEQLDSVGEDSRKERKELTAIKIAADTEIFWSDFCLYPLAILSARKIEEAAYGRWNCWTGTIRKYRESLQVILVSGQSEGVMESRREKKGEQQREKERSVRKLFYRMTWKRLAGN